MNRISKVLVANRGEIACRIIKTAKRMGIETVAVYSEADKSALHVKLASQAYCIGPAASQQSYLKAEKLISVAQETKSQAIHPGYGFLSENVEFAELCKLNNIIFIGPPVSAIRDMGIKNTSKEIMEAAGVPIVKGYHGEKQNENDLLEEARKIGFPIMIKAVRGGGGKGMRISHNEADFIEQLNSAKRESLKAFNDDKMLLEKFIETPRHVEVQIFGDHHANYVHLCERDCSVQRRHQKIIEEAPGPGISPEIRDRLGQAAVKAAAAVGYIGAGTVEFIMDANKDFYFMEMNTRLQVEHPITEMITGTDLVEWQFRVAAGEPLPITDQSTIAPRGHAFEARIYAEDCSSDSFMPMAGPIRFLRQPDPAESRVDTGYVEGDSVSVHYDSMIAKLVVWGPSRTVALARLAGALGDYQLVGLPTNTGFLQRLARHPAFAAGDVHTDFIRQHRDALFPPARDASELARDLCIAAVVNQMLDTLPVATGDGGDEEPGSDRYSPFRSGLSGFRVNHSAVQRVRLAHNSSQSELVVTQLGDSSYSVSDGHACQMKISGTVVPDNGRALIRLCLDDREQCDVAAFRDRLELHLFRAGRHEVFSLCAADRLALQGRPDRAQEGGAPASGRVGVAPMPGVIEKILVRAGQAVEQGAPLVTLIAMKMEYVVKAGHRGTVVAVHVAEGDTVAKNKQLVEVDPIS